MAPDKLRKFFRLLNRYLVVPLFRLGFGPFLGSPPGGYIMVLKTRGRKSGRLRSSPVNYAIHNGQVYCLAGWGKAADWYRNLRADPRVELIMPGGAYTGLAETVEDPDEKLIMVRQVLRNAGFAGFFEGYNPSTISDNELAFRITHLELVRIRIAGLGSGPADPGGWLWMMVYAGMALGLAAWLLGGRNRPRP